MAEWQRARLIPVSGIGSEKEAETRATSALLAVIEAVRELSVGLFSPLGASRAQKAEVRCYTEVPFKVGKGRSATRPDGLVQISYGKITWSALLEVKTGSAELNADQINGYWDVAREEGFDAVVTISNEIAPTNDIHPTDGLKVRANSKAKVHHYSWTAILSMCEVIKEHRGVEDPDQAWILGELIRYLRHPRSGADAFDDMGSDWVRLRDAARDDAVRRSEPETSEIAQRWDQLLRYAAFRLETDIGETVTQQLARSQRDPAKRHQYLVERLASDGQLDGTLRIPNTEGDLELLVDLRARRISASVTISAPDDRGGRARCTWLARQLSGEIHNQLTIESYVKKARNPTVVTLADVREDRYCLIGDDKRDPYRFRLTLIREMGVARKTSRTSKGFIDSVLGLITEFYGTVMQNLTPWRRPPPKITRSKPKPEPDTEPSHSTMKRIPPVDDEIETTGSRVDADDTGDDHPLPVPVNTDPSFPG